MAWVLLALGILAALGLLWWACLVLDRPDGYIVEYRFQVNRDGLTGYDGTWSVSHWWPDDSPGWYWNPDQPSGPTNAVPFGVCLPGTIKLLSTQTSPTSPLKRWLQSDDRLGPRC